MGKLKLSTPSFPTTPQISNFAPAQSIDPAQDFVVNWNSFTGAGANDFVQLIINDEFGQTVFSTGFPGDPTALPGTARSVTIPADTLAEGDSYNAVLTLGTSSVVILRMCQVRSA